MAGHLMHLHHIELPASNGRWLKRLHRAGVRRGNNLLFMGEAPHQLLVDVTKILGPYGSIMVASREEQHLAQIRTHANDESYQTRAFFSSFHPAIDVRAASEQMVPVLVKTTLLSGAVLPFSKAQFDLGILINDRVVAGNELDELRRVSSGRIAILTDTADWFAVPYKNSRL